MLVRFGIICLAATSVSTSMIPQTMIPQIFGACTGILLLVGLWTPVVGTLIVVAEVWIALTGAEARGFGDQGGLSGSNWIMRKNGGFVEAFCFVGVPDGI
jgi:hypothetical protein